MKLLSTRTHGIIDVVTAGTLLTLPRVLGWSDRVTGTLTKAALGTLGYSLLTRYEFGLIKVLPMRAHLWLDRMNGAMFCGAPLLFPDEDQAVTNALVGIGLFELGTALLTEPEPRSEAQDHRFVRDGGRPERRVARDFGDGARRNAPASQR